METANSIRQMGHAKRGIEMQAPRSISKRLLGRNVRASRKLK